MTNLSTESQKQNEDLFHKALKFIGVLEGGYSNHPADRGGATNKGITQKTYDKWRKIRCLPVQDVRLISDKEVELIYGQYWNEANCHNMTPKFAVLCFDTAVNMGTGRNKEFLEYAEYKFPEKFIEARRNAYVRIVQKNPSQKIFLKGWMNRMDKLEKFVQTIV